MVYHQAHRESLETIAAQATPPGRGGVGIIRVSGPRASDIARGCLGRLPKPRYALFSPFRNPEGEAVDEGIALYFPAPHSFTGEDVLELQGHGGPVVMDRLLKAVLAFGARPARPGEFTERAFLNGKIDLAQAEAIADLIDSAHEEAARCALHSLQGAFSERIQALVEALVDLRVYVEAALDFPEEDIDFLAEGALGERLVTLQERLSEIRESAAQGVLLREGMTVAIAGPPNAGKSTLLNALAGRNAAIVTPIPGTTRDVIKEAIHIDGLPLHLVDTAGLRESQDPIEREGMRRAFDAIERADKILWVIDGTLVPVPPPFHGRLREKCLTVLNKGDLTGCIGWREEGLALSAKTGEGLEHLREYLKGAMGYRGAGEGVFMARKRHLEALERAGEAIHKASLELEAKAGELLAEELRRAQEALSEITGEFTPEDLLGRIFSSFCIGK